MAPTMLRYALASLLAVSVFASPVERPSLVEKRQTALVGSGVGPIQSCAPGEAASQVLGVVCINNPSMTCPGIAAQQSNLAAAGATDPATFIAIATQENSGPNCAPGVNTILQPTVNTKPGQGGATNYGVFNNNQAAITTYCGSITTDQVASSISSAITCQQDQITGAGGFNNWAQWQRCGHPCSSTPGNANYTCGNNTPADCNTESQHYIEAINWLKSVQNNAVGTVGNVYLPGI